MSEFNYDIEKLLNASHVFMVCFARELHVTNFYV